MFFTICFDDETQITLGKCQSSNTCGLDLNNGEACTDIASFDMITFYGHKMWKFWFLF